MQDSFESQNEKRSFLIRWYESTRQQTWHLCKNLTPEDMTIQSMSDVSPIKWHLAHTSWFFERFILQDFISHYQPKQKDFYFLFNSYYESLGKLYSRDKRGFITRPTCEQIFDYRTHVDALIVELISSIKLEKWEKFERLMTIGIHHEMQHQELILMDCKYNFFQNPLHPAYACDEHIDNDSHEHPKQDGTSWTMITEGIYNIGATPLDSFSYDNEHGQHRVFLENVQICDKMVSNQEYREFIEDQGYKKHEYWLSEGWHNIQANNITKPLYWFKKNDQWFEFTLYGPQILAPNKPVSHINYFEADAFARWKGCRLPTEQEWEVFAQHKKIEGQFQESLRLHPDRQTTSSSDIFGYLWQWTSSSYSAYPGFKQIEGALGEYNGKFMCNQYVLRGGSFATPREHMRATYRNFFPAHSAWMFSGIRLAREITRYE